MMKQHTATAQTPDTFWTIIAHAQCDPRKLRTFLESMSRDELIAFYVHFRDAARALTAPEYREHMEPGTSEDGADDISRWVVVQGKEYYQDVVDHPNKIPFNVDAAPRASHRLYGEIGRVFYERFREELPTNAQL
ncbi:DUF4240 domain-containing protein [Sorangium sp. So ce388]|uniref:DUF4240 domain-containing protein n=1 Tax=Sorangium sp. So ce388 TaxID=3133309 RepID=UPI003F5AFCE8